MITGIILNWKRPANVARIVSGWRASGQVTQALVWNNNPQCELPPIPGATIISSNCDVGLYSRFAAMQLATNDCVLVQDDDLELAADTLATLHSRWLSDPIVLHCIFGRNPGPDGSYDARNAPAGDAAVILTRVLLTHRRHASDFFAVAPLFADIQREAVPRGNGEDILFSYVVRRRAERKHQVHRLPVTELPAPHSIHGRNWGQHLAHRSKLMKECERWLADEEYPF